MFDPAKQTWLIVAAPPAGFMYTDPVALQARAEPNATAADRVDTALAAQGMALIEVRSVYDTDGLQPHGRSRCWRPSTCRPAARAASRRPRRSTRPTRARRWPTWSR